MVLVAAAVCPHPPLLVPAAAAGAAYELDAVRAACDTAIGDLAAARPDVVHVVGGAPTDDSYGPSDGGSFRVYGVDVRAGLGEPTVGRATDRLPLAVLVGAWLLERRGWTGPRCGRGVPPSATAARCASIGAELAAGADRVALLVMGDGAARRTGQAPGSLDPRAEPYDASRLVLAGAAQYGGGRYTATLHLAAAPYGVGYFVAGWRAEDRKP